MHFGAMMVWLTVRIPCVHTNKFAAMRQQLAKSAPTAIVRSMSIWGTLLAGAAGLALGGPLGALIGLAAGHVAGQALGYFCRDDQVAEPATADADTGGPDGRRRFDPEAEAATQSIVFTIGVIALAAKMARADGVVKRVEIETFKRLFRVPESELDNVGKVFDLACRDSHGFEEYARQIAGLFQDRHAVLEELLDSLLAIAEADDELHETEVEYLRSVALIFGFDEADFARILAGHHICGTPPERDAHALLGVPCGADAATIKAAHRKLVREHHPDHLIAQGMPPEFIAQATQKLAAINAAYDQLVKQPALSGAADSTG